jgi:hypothetical protein
MSRLSNQVATRFRLAILHYIIRAMFVIPPKATDAKMDAVSSDRWSRALLPSWRVLGSGLLGCLSVGAARDGIRCCMGCSRQQRVMKLGIR